MAISAYTGPAQTIQAIQDLPKKGFTANFEFLDHALTDVENRGTFTANQLAIVAYRRFEGISDPDDMSVLYAIESDDGTKGIIVDAFGTYADPELGEFLESIRYLDVHLRPEALKWAISTEFPELLHIFLVRDAWLEALDHLVGGKLASVA